MRTSVKFSFAAAILAAFAAPAYAAGLKMVPEEGTVELLLLRQKSIRSELKLSEKEAEAIHKYAMDQWKKAEQVTELSKDEQERKWEEMARENERFIERTLTKDQRKRLEEIALQIAGLLFVTKRDIASQLNLTEEQIKRAHQFQKEARTELEEVIHSTKHEQRKEKLAELRKTNRKRLMDILTDDQEAKWKHMTGTPFTAEFEYDTTTTK